LEIIRVCVFQNDREPRRFTRIEIIFWEEILSGLVPAQDKESGEILETRSWLKLPHWARRDTPLSTITSDWVASVRRLASFQFRAETNLEVLSKAKYENLIYII
jgi:hypothetical protein